MIPADKSIAMNNFLKSTLIIPLTAEGESRKVKQ